MVDCRYRMSTSEWRMEDPFAIRNSPLAIALALAVLALLAGFRLSVLLALDHAVVAGQVARVTERAAELFVELDQRPRNAQTDGLGLAGQAAAAHVHLHVELANRVGRDERLVDRASPPGNGEVLGGVAVVD